MTYYSNWQAALIDFIKHYGHNFTETYTLLEEFEATLQQNINGTYFMYMKLETKDE